MPASACLPGEQCHYKGENDMFCRELIVLTAAVGLVSSASALDKQVGFDNHNTGKYTEAMASGDFSSNYWSNGLDEGRANIVGGSDAYSGKSLRITYEANEYGPSKNGVQFSYRFSKSNEMNLEYRLKFGSNFEWVKGGKLPGLCGGDCPSGGESADNGFSARYMWRVRNIDNSDRVLGEVYLYHPDMPNQYGEDFYFDNRQFQFQAGKWYKIRQYIKMNTVGSSNGVLKVWVDDQLVLSKSNLRFRLSSDVGIDHLSFSTFFGGGSSDWAPSSDQHAYFDDIHVYSGSGGGTTNPPVSDGGILDDFEDDVHRNALEGLWYDFDDTNSGGASTVTLDSVESGRSGGGLAARVQYGLDQGSYQYDPYIGVGTYLDFDKAGVDISEASGIKFWYKGGSDDMVVRIETADIAATERKAYYRVSLPKTTSWTEYSANWDEFTQPAWSGVTPMDLDLSQVVKISFQVKGNRNATSVENGSLLLDDVALPGLTALEGNDPGTGDPGTGDPGTGDPGTNPDGISILDDFEDMDNRSLVGGIWYDFNDSTNGGASSATADFTAQGKDGKGVSLPFTLDQGDYAYDPFVGLCVYMSSDKAAFDISNSTGITFWYKGGRDGTVLRIETASVAQTEKKAYHRVSIPYSSSWTEMTIQWDEFSQPAWSGVTPENLELTQVLKLSWQIRGDRNASGSESGELLLDEVGFVGDVDLPVATSPRAVASVSKLGYELRGRMLVVTGAANPTCKLYDSRGRQCSVPRLVSSGSTATFQIQAGLPAGMYVARIKSSEGRHTSLRLRVE